MQTVLGILGFGGAAIAFAVVAALVVASGDRSRQVLYLCAALLASAVWGVWHAVAGSNAPVPFFPWSIVVDAARDAFWIACLIVIARNSGTAPSGRRIGLVLLSGALLASLTVMITSVFVNGWETAPQFAFVAKIVVSLAGILGLERLYRHSDVHRRSVLEPLALGVGFLFAADALVYLFALMFADTASGLSILRAIANVLAALAIAMTARRMLRWNSVFFMSRDFTFYVAGLIGVALYIATIFAGAQFFGSNGSRWGLATQAVLLLAGVIVLYRLLHSEAARRQIRVFITKHFYRERYDYRKEWLRLIETLVGRTEDASIAVRAVRALAEIIGSDKGELWLENGPGVLYDPHGSWGGPMPAKALNKSDALPAYLAKSHWVVDTQEYLNKPGVYSNVFSFDEPFLRQPSIYVPILHDDRLIGIVRLERPRGIGDLSFEDHDLLKTAGQQVAVFLVQERAQEQLFETRQFEAFSKLTAFLMHDLKNVIAQQNLVVANARRFRHRPEFIDDAMSTIASSVDRMRRILERLEGATRFDKPSRIQLLSLLREVCSDCADRNPAPMLAAPKFEDLVVEMDRDRLNMVVTHLVRNAQDATEADGRVEVLVTREDDFARIDVSDTGCGMDSEFIRDRLFKPFDSTKGAQGMGIGAYQIRETVISAGGSIEVRSEPGVGTTMTIRLPVTAARVSTEPTLDGERTKPSSRIPDTAGS